MDKKQIRSLKRLLYCLLPAVILLLSRKASAYDGSIDQTADHSGEDSMYLYTVNMVLDNPCNSNDMDTDAINELTFTFTYLSDNGYGSSKTYTLDMSWNGSRNLNEEIVKSAFIRPNDKLCYSSFQVWVPGLVTKVAFHLNMDGGERLTFTVEEILLNGFRVNTEKDYVTSAYYDSDDEVSCRVPASVPVTNADDSLPADARDQFGGQLSETTFSRFKEKLAKGLKHIFYHR